MKQLLEVLFDFFMILQEEIIESENVLNKIIPESDKNLLNRLSQNDNLSFRDKIIITPNKEEFIPEFSKHIKISP